jgi:hypothetical protein
MWITLPFSITVMIASFSGPACKISLVSFEYGSQWSSYMLQEDYTFFLESWRQRPFLHMAVKKVLSCASHMPCLCLSLHLCTCNSGSCGCLVPRNFKISCGVSKRGWNSIFLKLKNIYIFKSFWCVDVKNNFLKEYII